MENNKNNLIIIGGGIGGLISYHKLKSYYNIILIDPKDSFEYSPEIVSAISAYPNYLDALIRPYDQFIAKDCFVQGIVTKIHDQNTLSIKTYHGFDLTQTKLTSKGFELLESSELENTIKVKTSYLIIATGASYSFPIKHNTCAEDTYTKTDRVAKLKNCFTGQSPQGKKVCIFGGGYVSIEMVGFMAKTSQVTLVTRSDRLVKKLNDQVRERIVGILQGLNVEIVYNTDKNVW